MVNAWEREEGGDWVGVRRRWHGDGGGAGVPLVDIVMRSMSVSARGDVLQPLKEHRNILYAEYEIEEEPTG